MNQNGLISQAYHGFINWLSTSKQSYLWGSVTTFFSTLSIQDYTFIIGAVFSALMTYKTYRSNVREKELKRIEDMKRTKEVEKQTLIIQNYLQEHRLNMENPSTADAIGNVTSAVKKANEYTDPSVPVGAIDEKSTK